MIKYNYDFRYHYYTTFDDMSGAYFRSNVIGEDGIMTNEEPFRADFPHLIDVGIMGHCLHGLSGRCEKAGVFCYQEGNQIQSPNMLLEDYEKILKECSGKVQQLALGGRGDADCHEEFETILRLTRKYGIVPNITTSGYQMTEEKAKWIKNYCGAAAVSWYQTEYTFRAISVLLSEGVTTNIHFILSEHSIEDACIRLENKDFPKGIGAVIFLLYKPIGNVNLDLVLTQDNPYLERFFKLIDQNDFPFGIGFDSCSTTGIVSYCHEVDEACIEPCEGGRFSAYVDAEMKMYPCSFAQKEAYSIDLKKYSIQEAWDSSSFDSFRERFFLKCVECKKRVQCLGGCPTIDGINLCREKGERK